MGEYFEWINFDKREFLSNYPWNHGYKLLESCVDDREETGAVSALLENRWAGDMVVFMGDYYTGVIDNPRMKTVEAEIGKFGEELQFRAEVVFTDITGVFEQAKGECSHLYCLEKREVIDTPYEGPFTMRPIWRRYVINDTKRVFYDRRKTPVVWVEDRAIVHRFDPLPIYLGTDLRGEEGGTWIGDALRFQDNPPVAGYADVSSALGWPYDRAWVVDDDEDVLAIVNTREYRHRVLCSGRNDKNEIDVL